MTKKKTGFIAVALLLICGLAAAGSYKISVSQGRSDDGAYIYFNDSDSWSAGDVFQYNGSAWAAEPLIDKTDVTAVQGTSTNAITGSTVAISSGASSGDALEVVCGGTISGTNGAKNIDLYAGSTAIAELDSQGNSNVGDFHAEFTVLFSGSTEVNASGSVIISDGATVIPDSDYATTGDVDITSGITFAVKTTLGNNSDYITTEYCKWKYSSQ